jgi:hypothetical protein
MPKGNMKQHAITYGLNQSIYAPKQRRLFTNRPQRTTTGQLLLETALFATENKRFQEGRDQRVGHRAQIHLRRIKELSEQLRAELATLMLNDS